jgi:hypothetical protein
MDIDTFMRGYQAAWQQRDEHLLCSLFSPDGVYHNTPFASQHGHVAIAQYWQRVKLQEDIRLDFEVIARTGRSGVAHWHVTYQVASEELFRIWAASSGTNLLARNSGDPLPRLALDGMLMADFNDAGLCQTCRLWWHSQVLPAAATPA